MKPESLKFQKRILLSERGQISRNIAFEEDVKSTVQGLLEEIDKLPTETIFDKVAETEDGMVITPFKFIKKKSVIDLIKKWFPDVVEDENNL